MVTSQYPASGGEIIEVVLNDEISNFNPLLDSKTETERKVSDMLFSPLFEIRNDGSFNNILIKDDPEVVNKDEQYYIEFELKNDLKWSNDKKITTVDIEYSFERIKESGGDDRFHLTFQQLDLEIIDDNKFKIITQQYTEELEKNINFRPISFSYYNGQRNIGLRTDSKSFSPQVVSGDYSVPSFITNPLDSNDTNRQNPMRNNNNEYFLIKLIRRKEYELNSSYINEHIIIVSDEIYDTNNNTLSVDELNQRVEIDLISGDYQYLNQKREDLENVINKKFTTYQINSNSNLLFISNLNNENVYLKFRELKDIINCEIRNAFEIDFKSSTDNCNDIEGLKNILFDQKDTRGFKIFSENSEGKILYYKTPISLKFIGKEDVLQFLKTDEITKPYSYVDLEFNIAENFEYKNLFLNNIDYDFSIVESPNLVLGVNTYNDLPVDYLNYEKKNNTSQQNILINNNLKFENNTVYINIKRW